jgi:hypothetical protein
VADIRTGSKKAANAIIKALDVLTYSPAIAAQTLTKASGPIQHRLYLTIRAIIRLWAIDARHGTYDKDFSELYKWAREHDEDNR